MVFDVFLSIVTFFLFLFNVICSLFVLEGECRSSLILMCFHTKHDLLSY